MAANELSHDRFVDNPVSDFSARTTMHTVVHVTHEAVQKIGGIGAVLQGLLTSKHYLANTRRNILVGPYWHTGEEGEQRLGSAGEVLYSSLDGINRTPLGTALREIENTFGVGIVYGRRKFSDKDTGVTAVPEILLIDVSRYEPAKIGFFKFRLWEKFGVNSARYDHIWDYEQWMRLAEPTIAALKVMGAANVTNPAVILSHEYMGMPTVMAAILEGEAGGFRSIFYAHEVATMRRIVEHHNGHDTMFYNAMKLALPNGHHVEDVFGPQDDFYKHALIRNVKYCDEIFGVGDYVLKEFRFMGESFAHVDASLAYNGVPHFKIDLEEKMRSRNKLRKYCSTLLGFEPDFVFTHVTRLVPSKGMWRDLKVLQQVENELRPRNESAVLFVLSTEGLGRRPDDILRMERDYEWPVSHREGSPDLSGGEAHYYQGVQAFNARSRNTKVIYLNQFGFDRRACGNNMPIDMEFMDIRKGSDVEFGQSIYEPFGIAQVEPISFGGICVYTSICGCAGFVRKAAQQAGVTMPDGTFQNVIEADYTNLPDHLLREDKLLGVGKAEREAVELIEAKRIAGELVKRLPVTPREFEPFIERGQKVADYMSWDAVTKEYIIPGIERAAKAQRLKAIA
jgi:glycosyltransferase involved in cell wall biosynthesis